MKINKTLYVGLLTACMLLSSCLSDLDLQPIDPDQTTADKAYNSPAAYKQGLAKLYASFVLTGQRGPAGNSDLSSPDEGNGSFLRLMWNMEELTTDEAVWTYPNDYGSTVFNLHYQTWLPPDGIFEIAYARVMNSVVLANEYLRVTAGNSNPEIVLYRNEARFLRALAYYYGLNLWGRMAFVTEEDLPGAFFPPEILRADLFNYVEAELLAVKGSLGDAQFEYGRADKATCSMLLAKLYLNARVYLGLASDAVTQTYYTKAITELNEVIAGPYTLAPNYLNNFLADNNTSPEMIFAINSDGYYSQSYSAVWTMIKGNAGNGGWAGLRTTKALVNLFSGADHRDHFADESDGQQLEIEAMNNSTHGYGVFKFRNVNSDGSIPNDGTDFTDTDYPVFRLADAYLMYAEAVVRGGTGGDVNTAVGYINELRNRPDDPAIGDITSGQLTLDFILDERARELYWEGHRRTDLIRFSKFTGGAYLWPWKGNVAEGTATESFRDLFPVPAADRALNKNLSQNTGYAGAD